MTSPSSVATGSELHVQSDRLRVTSELNAISDVRVRPDGGQWMRLHSARNPRAEAAALVDRALGSGEMPAVAAIIGAGLGYVVDEVLRRRSDIRIVVLEVLPELLPFWTERPEIAALIAEGRLVVGSAPEFVLRPASWPGAALAADPAVIVMPVIGQGWPVLVDRARRVLMQFMFERRANEEARQRLAPVYLEHTLANIPALIDAADVSALEGVAAGSAVILCGAGPSLDRLIPELRRNRDRAWMVALDTALHPLLAAGIVPDLVVSIDPTMLNGRHLLNLPLRRRPWLVSEASVDPRVMSAFRGRTFACRVNRADPWPWLESLGLAPTRVRAWGSVLTAACDLVNRMKPASVAFAAVDLAYTLGQTYCRGTVFEQDWENQRVLEQLPDINDVWEARLQGRTIDEADVHGVPTRTAKHLLAFRNWVRAWVADTPECRFANVSGAGILHGPGIHQETADAWLATQTGPARQPETVLQQSAIRPWRVRADQVRSAAVALAEEQGEPWSGWHQRVLQLDAIRLARVAALTARRLGADKGAGEMSGGQSDWVDVPFESANFYAQTPMRWVVPDHAASTYSYRVDGKTLMLSFKLYYTHLLDEPSREIYLRLPAGYLPARGTANAVWIGTRVLREMGYATVHPGLDVLVVHRGNEDVFPIEDGHCSLFGQITFEVQ